MTEQIPLIDVKAQYAPLIPSSSGGSLRLSSPAGSSSGPRSTFESEAAAFLGVRTDRVANGTDALVLALEALGIGRDDEVVRPAFTFYATAEAIAVSVRHPSSPTSIP